MKVQSKAQLVQESFANDKLLAVRIETHRCYSDPLIDLPAWTLDHYTWRGDEVVLDVGTGTGQYLGLLRERLPRGRLIGADLAPGMLRDLQAKSVPGGAMLLNADAEALPLLDASCDVVVAAYVLFFVPNISRALAELRRILRPGGALLVVTAGDPYMAELYHAINCALEKLGAPASTHWSTLSGRFSLESGPAQLTPYFEQVVSHCCASAFVFRSAEPVLAYVNSIQDSLREDLPPGRSWDEFLAVLRQVVAAALSAHGEFRVSKPAGILIATKQARA